MKKTIALITIAALVLVAAASLVVSAATPGQPGPQRQVPTLTEAQKQELAPLYNQMIETQKQITQKYVDFGYITQWQADQRNAMMQERMNQRIQSGHIPGTGMMGKGPRHGHGPGFGRGGFGPGNGPCAQQQPPAANQ